MGTAGRARESQDLRKGLGDSKMWMEKGQASLQGKPHEGSSAVGMSRAIRPFFADRCQKEMAETRALLNFYLPLTHISKEKIKEIS